MKTVTVSHATGPFRVVFHVPEYCKVRDGLLGYTWYEDERGGYFETLEGAKVRAWAAWEPGDDFSVEIRDSQNRKVVPDPEPVLISDLEIPF